jgi:hypothetical protein
MNRSNSSRSLAWLSKNSAKPREFSGAPFDQGEIPRPVRPSPAFTMLTTKPGPTFVAVINGHSSSLN